MLFKTLKHILTLLFLVKTFKYFKNSLMIFKIWRSKGKDIKYMLIYIIPKWWSYMHLRINLNLHETEKKG